MELTLVEMKAGRMSFDGKKVAPDNRQGQLRLLIREGQEAMILSWRATPEGQGPAQEEEVVFITADEVEAGADPKFERVPVAKTGRVYVFKMRGERRFFWSQETDESAEKGLVEQFSSFLAGETSSGDEDFMDVHAHGGHEGLQSQADMQAFPMYVPSNSGDGATSGMAGDISEEWAEMLASGDANEQEMLQWMLQQISDQNGEEVALESIITREVLQDLVNNDADDISDQLKDLLPQGQSVAECLLSAQFMQAIKLFGAAVNSEEGAEALYATLGLEPGDGDEIRSPVEAFLHALVRKFAE